MTLERRRAIAEVACRHDLCIVEDDAYGLLLRPTVG
jgi:DNA-binding transcriptional MocR family regulator